MIPFNILIHQGCTNFRRHITLATKPYKVAHNICGSPVQNLLQFTLVAPEILRWFLDFGKPVGPRCTQLKSVITRVAAYYTASRVRSLEPTEAFTPPAERVIAKASSSQHFTIEVRFRSQENTGVGCGGKSAICQGFSRNISFFPVSYQDIKCPTFLFI